MSRTHIALLRDRGVVAVTGPDAEGFLDNLVTNDIGTLAHQPAVHAGLLTPQGKLLFEFLVVRNSDGFLLDTGRERAADLVRRLGLYKLRAAVTINDLSASRVVVAAWGGPPPALPLAVAYADPRHAALGHRLIAAPEIAARLAVEDEGEAAWHRHRIGLGVPEAGLDYALGDTFPHEADFDRFAGVSFTKGCFVGQEVVARMQHKTVVRKRIVPVSGDGPLAAGDEVRIGEAAIGRIGSVAGHAGLALVRLDRAAEAVAKGQPLHAGAGAVVLTIRPEVLDAYRAEAAARTAG